MEHVRIRFWNGLIWNLWKFFLHFKGKKYKVLTAIAEHTETGEKFV